MVPMYEGDTLVVSEETEVNARRILKEKGYVCQVAVVPMAKDLQGREIHSTQIVLEEMRKKKEMEGDE